MTEKTDVSSNARYSCEIIDGDESIFETEQVGRKGVIRLQKLRKDDLCRIILVRDLRIARGN